MEMWYRYVDSTQKIDGIMAKQTGPDEITSFNGNNKNIMSISEWGWFNTISKALRNKLKEVKFDHEVAVMKCNSLRVQMNSLRQKLKGLNGK